MSQEPFHPRPAFCASLLSQNAHGYVTRKFSYGSLHGKCCTRIPDQHFARARVVKMHVDMSPEPLHMKMYVEGQCCALIPDQHFVRASTVKMHMNTSQDVYRFTGKVPDTPVLPRLNTGPYCSCYCKNPSVWPISLGKTVVC